MWLFHLHSTLKNRAFFQFSPRRDPRLRYFSGYPFGVSRKKASTIFYNTAFFFSPLQSWEKSSTVWTRPNTILKNRLRHILCGCVIFTVWWKYGHFLHLFRRWTSCLGPFIGHSFGLSRNKASTASHDMALGSWMPSWAVCFCTKLC